MLKQFLSTSFLFTIILLIGCADEQIEEKNLEPISTAGNLENGFLTEKEREAYENFKKDFDLTYLKDLEPISVAKLYVHAGFEKKYDVQYALYTDREEYVRWSKEEDEQISEKDRGTDEQNTKVFANIDKGVFKQINDFEGVIEYSPDEHSTTSFHLIQNEDGVWQVSFMPIQ